MVDNPSEDPKAQLVPTSSSMALTVEQQQFLDAVEDEFSNRFTETDAVFWEEHTNPLPGPPLIEPWYNKPRRRFNFADRGRGQGPHSRDNSAHGNFDRAGSSGHNRFDRYRRGGHHNQDRRPDFGRHDRREGGRDRNDDSRENHGYRRRDEDSRGNHGYRRRDEDRDHGRRSSDRDREYRPRRDNEKHPDSPGSQSHRS